MAQKITNLEMIEVLLGQSDPAQNKRVQDAVGRDGRLAQEYERWEKILPALIAHGAEIEGSAARVQSAVMEKIAQGAAQRTADEAWFPQNPIERFLRDRLLLGLGVPRWRPILLAASGALVLALVAVTIFSIRGRWADYAVVQTAHGTVQWFDAKGNRHEASQDQRVPLHSRIVTGSEGRLALQLRNETLMTFAENTEATWAEVAMVHQKVGKAIYRTKHGQRPSTGEALFSVVTPHGVVEDLGTEFSVDVRKEDVSVVEVEAGTVRIRPRDGGANQATAGDRGLMNAQRVVVEKPLQTSEKTQPKTEEKQATALDVMFSPKRVPLKPDDELFDFILPEAKSSGRDAQVWLGEVEIPKTDSPKVRHLYSLIDTDLDGDFSDANGALGIWSVSIDDGKPRMQSVSPPASPTLYAGYKWQMEDRDGAYHLVGQKIESTQKPSLRPGDLLPPVEAATIDGQKIRMEAPGDGFLLIYTWTTWFSACQRDVPFAFESLYSRFKDRGLRMVGVAVDPMMDSVVNYLNSNRTEYPQIYNGPDITAGVTGQLGIHQAPWAVLVDSQGQVVSVGKSSSEIWSFLDAHLPKNP